MPAGAIGEQLLQDALLGGAQFAARFDQMHKFGAEGAHRYVGGDQILPEFLQAKTGEGG